MKKIAIVYGSLSNSIQMRAVKELSEFLLDYTFEYPICVEYGKFDVSDYRCIYVGTKENNPYIKNESDIDLTHEEEYYIKVKDNTAIIQGSDDKGVLYGCIDFYNKYILKFEYPHDGCTYRFNIFENETLPEFEHTSRPSVKNRGLWTWGHVIYDYRGYLDNMVKLKMNSIIIWNDFPPINAKNIYEFLPTCTDTDGRMFFTVTEDGKEIQKRRYYFSETFAAIGCAEYYKATGDKTALEDAKKCVEEILNGGFLTEHALLESVSTDGKFVDSPSGRIVNPGHSMEAAWFLMSEVIISKNQDAIDAGKKIIDFTWPLGWDEKKWRTYSVY